MNNRCCYICEKVTKGLVSTEVVALGDAHLVRIIDSHVVVKDH